MHAIEYAIENAIKFRKYNSLITETFELARSQAKSALRNGREPFPIVVKDCFTTKGVRTTCASKMLENYVGPYTATVVQRLIDHGACIIGKANLDEFCMGTSTSQSYFGPTKNGLTDEADLDKDWYIPGGSSGGPAVAVQLGIAELGLGSDTGGSSRNPAARTGIFGLKPSYGILSRHGLIPLVNSLDCPAVLSTSAKNCNRFLEMMCGKDAQDSTSLDVPPTCFMQKKSSGLTIGVPKEYFHEKLSIECWNAWNEAAKLLLSMNCKIKEVSMPYTEYSIICYHVLAEADIASNMARYDGIKFGFRSSNTDSTHSLYASSRSESLNEIVRRRIFAGNYFLMKKHYDEYFGQALRVRRLIKLDFDRVFNAESCDVLLTPVTCGPPPRFKEINYCGSFDRERVEDYFTQPANMAGIPAVSVPFTKSKQGLPIGVQVMADYLHDGLVLDVAHMLTKR